MDDLFCSRCELKQMLLSHNRYTLSGQESPVSLFSQVFPPENGTAAVLTARVTTHARPKYRVRGSQDKLQKLERKKTPKEVKKYRYK